MYKSKHTLQHFVCLHVEEVKSAKFKPGNEAPSCIEHNHVNYLECKQIYVRGTSNPDKDRAIRACYRDFCSTIETQSERRMFFVILYEGVLLSFTSQAV